MNMPKQTGRRGVLGFSMAEMLIVVAIMAVLGGVGTVAGRQVLRSTRQTALDRMAEQIYMAASQNIRTLEAAGLQGQVIALSEELKKQYVNSGMDLPALSNHDASTEELRNLILPAKSMSSELENGLWALEFVPGSNGQVSYYEEDQGKYCPMRVNSVFFIRSEDKNSYLYLNIGDRSDYFTLWTLLATEDIRENLKNRAYRMNETDARIGFYDGSSGGEVKVDGESQTGNKKDQHGLSLSVSNGEELTVTCTCDSTDPNATFILKLTAPDGTTAYLKSGSEDNSAWSITYEDSKPVCTFTLDSLKSPDTQFKNLPFQDADGKSVHLTPGENYTLSLVVEQGGKS
ncbi:MAG: hypothetical protein IJT94_01115, partial [Oscillibacter sp.]|nr:hypothetical protein [Oscillibacter sp.]